MAFIDERFPTQISQRFTPEIIWQDERTSNFGGYDSVDQRWSSFLWRFSINFVRNRYEYDELFNFMASVPQGRANRFRFRHPEYFSATDQFNVEIPAITRNSSKVYQLIRQYRYGTKTVVKKVTRPVHNGVMGLANTVKIYTRDGGQPLVEVPSGDATYPWTVSESTGIVTFTSADPFEAGDPLTVYADYEYDIPVRLETPNTPMPFVNKQVRAINGIVLEEVRE